MLINRSGLPFGPLVLSLSSVPSDVSHRTQSRTHRPLDPESEQTLSASGSVET